MLDKVVIYDEVNTAAIAANAYKDLASLNAGEKFFAIEEIWLWPPYYGGAPDDLKELQILLDGEPYPGRLHIRAKGGRNMAIPMDDRYVIKNVPLGEVSNDPLKDTCIKVLPAQKVAVRLNAGASTGVRAATKTRVMLVGRVAKNDKDLRELYGAMYQPMGAQSISDVITGKTTPPIVKGYPVTLENAKQFSGSIQQSLPKIYPWMTFASNKNQIPATPEYEWSYREPANVAEPFMDLRFDWTRITNKALLIRHLGAILDAGKGKVWILQDSVRRPGVDLLFYGWTVDADYPNLIPPGTDIAHMQGPLDLAEIKPRILAFNNLTEFRTVADPGTTIAADKLELQLRGMYVEW